MTKNDDWTATCSIYGYDDDMLVNGNAPTNGSKVAYFRDPIDKTSSVGTIQLTIGLHPHTLWMEYHPGEKDDNASFPSFGFQRIHEAPSVQVSFHYNSNSEPVSVDVFFIHYPEHYWPASAKYSWLQWLSEKATELLREHEISYSVCAFVEHEATNFFKFNETYYENNNTSTGTTGKEPADESIHVILTGEYRMDRKKLQFLNQVGKRKKKPAVVLNSSHSNWIRVVRKTIFKNYKKWIVMIEGCPICLDTVYDPFQILPCGHYFCRDCITHYAVSIVNQLQLQKENPFSCPLPDCKQKILIVNCVKKLLTTTEMDQVRRWYKDIVTPYSQCLQICPRKQCQSKEMRKLQRKSHAVSCDECNAVWCELCLHKIGSNTGSNKTSRRAALLHTTAQVLEKHDSQCDPTKALTLCEQYRAANDTIKEAFERRWPWIKAYATTRLDDLAMEWITNNNAQRCPNCQTGIERIDGCFHMNCTVCWTHFCYDCGEEIFPPYYNGSHQCPAKLKEFMATNALEADHFLPDALWQFNIWD